MSKELETLPNEDILAIVDEIVTKEELAKSQAAEMEKSGNVSTPADGGEPVDGPGPGTSEDAVKGKKKKSDKDLGAVDGAGVAEASVASTGGSEAVANPKSEGGFIAKSQEEVFEKMMKSIEKVAQAVGSLAQRVEAVETKSTQSLRKSVTAEEEIRKSVTAEVAERLSKSYLSQMEEMKKAQVAVITEANELRKSNDEIKKSNSELQAKAEELQKSLKKPADTRASVRNVDVVEKSVAQESEGRIFKSKADVCDALEELRKSGKVSNTEVIEYNVSNTLSDSTKKLLKGLK